MNRIGKKAQGFLVAIKLVESLKIILLVIFGIGIFLYLLTPKSVSVDTEQDIQKMMYLRGITGTPDCMAYEEVGGRIDQRILDQEKITSSRLNDCLDVPENRDVSNTISGSLHFKETKQAVNSSQWVFPLLFEYAQSPVIIKEENKEIEDIATLYVQLR